MPDGNQTLDLLVKRSGLNRCAKTAAIIRTIIMAMTIITKTIQLLLDSNFNRVGSGLTIAKSFWVEEFFIV